MRNTDVAILDNTEQGTKYQPEFVLAWQMYWTWWSASSDRSIGRRRKRADRIARSLTPLAIDAVPIDETAESALKLSPQLLRDSGPRGPRPRVVQVVVKMRVRAESNGRIQGEARCSLKVNTFWFYSRECRNWYAAEPGSQGRSSSDALVRSRASRIRVKFIWFELLSRAKKSGAWRWYSCDFTACRLVVYESVSVHSGMGLVVVRRAARGCSERRWSG